MPAWATPAHAVGTPAAGQQVTVSVALALRNAAAAEQLAAAVSTPGSAQYGRYVTPAQFNARFAPTATEVSQVKSFLGSQGLTSTSVAAGNRWVTATGSVATVSKAFGVTLRTYSYNGKHLYAPSADASVPSSIRSSVLAVNGLDQSGLLRHPLAQRVAPDGAKPAAAPAPAKCSSYWSQHSQTLPPAYPSDSTGRDSWPTYICGYTPDQMQSAYGVKGAIAKDRDGYGVRVAIIDAYASPTMRQDANRYSRDNGLPTFKNGQYREKTFRPFNLQSACGGEAGWNVEETLDVESVHSMAPGANILYVGAKNCDTGIDGALNYVVQQRAADMVSNSYGNLGEAVPASEINVEHSIFVQAGAEGIGMYFSSGDSGDEFANTGVTQPDYPASDPKVTAVGGTSLAVNAAGGYQFETGWGSSIDFVNSTGDGYDAPPPGDFAFGAGGGASTIFKQPDYQRGVVPANLSHRGSGPAMRVSPDVAANADPYTGFLVGQTSGGVYSTFAIGGTSLACPLFTGVQALVSQG
ncbi:MAG: S53 family peptidase, partial [Mycobacteriales bacterium]